jgi:hypothetical protein
VIKRISHVLWCYDYDPTPQGSGIENTTRWIKISYHITKQNWEILHVYIHTCSSDTLDVFYNGILVLTKILEF